MFKFLRKYNKWILAVGGTLLMIVFLIPQAITALSQRAAMGSAVWATVGPDGEEIPSSVRKQCANELTVLETLQRVDPSLYITDKPEHWYLLCLEAEQAGLLGGRAADQLSPEQLQVFASIAGTGPTVDQALSKRFAIQRLIRLYTGAGKLSDTRLRGHAAREFMDVDVRFIALEAEAHPDAPDPSEEEIRRQYEAYRDVDPDAAPPEEDETAETGPHFGYRLPDRFKVEWLRVSTDSIREMIEASDALNAVALYKHWRANQGKEEFPPYESGGEIPDAVRADLLAQLITERRDEIRKSAADRLLASSRRLRSEEGYRVLPDDWAAQRVDFRELAQDLQTEFPGLALPEYHAVGDRWLKFTDLAELDGLDNAVSDEYGSRPVKASAFIAAAKEFGGHNSILTQVGLAGPPLRDGDDDSLVFFRITEADPARPPASLDEVRDQVVSDLKRQSDYKRLLAEATGLEAQARRDGLLATAMDLDVEVQPRTGVHLDSATLLTFQLQNNYQLTRLTNLPVLGPHRPTIERIVDHVRALPNDVPVRERPADDRIFTLPVDDKMVLLVVEVLDATPLFREQLAQLTGLGLPSMLIFDELQDSGTPLNEVFGYDAMKARHNFNVKTRAQDDDTVANADGDEKPEG